VFVLVLLALVAFAAVAENKKLKWEAWSEENAF
jgi:hypothetical protein